MSDDQNTNRGGRPKKPASKRRDHRISAWVNDDELARIEAAADKRSMNRGVYLREAALSQKGVQHIPSVNLNAAHELGPIGVNLNQQTRALNRLVTMLREGAAEPDETVARLENLLEEFRPTLERLSERVAQLQLNLLGVPR